LIEFIKGIKLRYSILIIIMILITFFRFRFFLLETNFEKYRRIFTNLLIIIIKDMIGNKMNLIFK